MASVVGQVYVLLTVCLLVFWCGHHHRAEAQDARDLGLVISAVDPPRRPNQFRNIDELNKYLAELRQYYTILGRPRFGRSTDRQMARESLRKSLYNDDRLQ